MNEKIIDQLHDEFGQRLQENVHMANYTTMNVGGEADALLILNSTDELEKAVNKLWEMSISFVLLGSGSNVLVSDRGIREVVIINHAHNVKINTRTEPAQVWAESGALLSQVARQVALRGLNGIEWATALPGTVGGAVYGNAGAFGRDISCNLSMAEILDRREGKQTWQVERLEYAYRSSLLKRQPQDALVLSATFHFDHGDPTEIRARMDDYRQKRINHQPPGPSMGSVFRNPTGDKAGRLIEATMLKGKKIGGAEISPIHANFIINTSGATSNDVLSLIKLAQNEVEEKMGVHLIPEIQVLGDWENKQQSIIDSIYKGSG